MKKFFTSALVLLLFASCNSSEIEKLQEGNGKIITAKIENASEFSNIAGVKLVVGDVPAGRYVVLARGEWKDGGFTIELPKTVAPNQLLPFVNNNSFWPATTSFDMTTVTVSNENVKIVDVRFVGVDKDDNAVTIFVFWKIDEVDPMNIDRAILTYADSDVTISGYTMIEGPANPRPGYGNHNWFAQTLTYSIEWEKGWNIWYSSRHRSMIGSTYTMTMQRSSTPVSGLKWYAALINWPILHPVN